MDDKRKQEHLHDVDKVLADVREHLQYNLEQGEMYELRALQLLLQVTKAMHSTHHIHPLMTMILDSVISFEEADRAFVMMLDENGAPRFKMGRSAEGAYLSESDFVISTSVVRDTLERLLPVILLEPQHDSAYGASKSIHDLKLRTIMAAPLRYQEQILGLIYVDSKRPMSRYSKHHLNVLTSLAEQAAVAIYNARKFETYNG